MLREAILKNFQNNNFIIYDVYWRNPEKCLLEHNIGNILKLLNEIMFSVQCVCVAIGPSPLRVWYMAIILNLPRLVVWWCGGVGVVDRAYDLRCLLL